MWYGHNIYLISTTSTLLLSRFLIRCHRLGRIYCLKNSWIFFSWSRIQSYWEVLLIEIHLTIQFSPGSLWVMLVMGRLLTSPILYTYEKTTCWSLPRGTEQTRTNRGLSSGRRTPVSSQTSRTPACWVVSPWSRNPPGTFHLKLDVDDGPLWEASIYHAPWYLQ